MAKWAAVLFFCVKVIGKIDKKASKLLLPTVILSCAYHCSKLTIQSITCHLQVETSDHARLQIKLAFNNYFEINRTDPQSVAKIFSINDFIGFACKQVGKC